MLNRKVVTIGGNPPDKPKVPEVEFSKKEVLHEEIEIYGQPDHGCTQACRSRAASARDMPGAGYQHRHFLQVARQIRRHGHLHDGQHEGTRRREPAAQEAVHRGKDQGRDRC